MQNQSSETETSDTLLSRRHSSSVHGMVSPLLESQPVEIEYFESVNDYKELIVLLVLIGGWYVFSLSISLYNKWMFGQSKLNLPFPILITSLHQLLLSIVSYLIIEYTKLKEHKDETPFNHKVYLSTILPCAIGSAGDIGFGNMSFRFINLSTYTMVKSSAIAFVLLFSVLAKIERFTYTLLGIVIVMTFGVVLMSDKDDKSSENKFFFLGFILVLLSACMSGLRWVLTQLLLRINENFEKHHNNKSKKHPIFTINQLSPTIFFILFIIGLALEGGIKFIQAEIWEERGVIQTLLLLLFPGFLVLFMTIFEYAILQRSKVLTLSIAGIFKEILTILVSLLIFEEHLTFINVIGLMVTLVDIIWYNYYRYNQNLKDTIETIELERRI